MSHPLTWAQCNRDVHLDEVGHVLRATAVGHHEHAGVVARQLRVPQRGVSCAAVGERVDLPRARPGALQRRRRKHKQRCGVEINPPRAAASSPRARGRAGRRPVQAGTAASARPRGRARQSQNASGAGNPAAVAFAASVRPSTSARAVSSPTVTIASQTRPLPPARWLESGEVTKAT